MLRVKNHGANRIHLQGKDIDENNSHLTLNGGKKWNIEIVPSSPNIDVMKEENVHGYAVLTLLSDLLQAHHLSQPIVSTEIWQQMCRIDDSLREGDVEKVRPKA